VITRRILASLGVLLFSLPVAASWLEPGIPLQVKSIAAAMFALALVRPQWALSVLAGLLPLAPRIALQTSAPFTSAEMAELMVAPFLCASSLRLTFDTGAGGSRLIWPAVSLSAVIAVAGVLGMRAEQLPRAFPAVFLASLRHHWLTSYFGDQSAFITLHIAMTWIEALALAVLAERLIRAYSASASWVVRSFLAGATITTAFAWLRVIEVARRNGFTVAELWHFLLTQRISTLYADVNAAGSLFALYLVPAVWLALIGRRSWRWAWLAAVVILGGLWVTGSRMALVAAVVGMAAASLTDRRWSRRMVAIGAVAAAALIAGVILWNPGRSAQSSSSVSLQVRWSMAQIAGRAAAAHPAFGIGLGQFRPFAREHASAALIALFPAAARGENAHNNFLQVLAELGFVGFLAFLWMISACAAAVVAAVRGRCRDRRRPVRILCHLCRRPSAPDRRGALRVLSRNWDGGGICASGPRPVERSSGNGVPGGCVRLRADTVLASAAERRSQPRRYRRRTSDRSRLRRRVPDGRAAFRVVHPVARSKRRDPAPFDGRLPAVPRPSRC
jgi:hypothetical protein